MVKPQQLQRFEDGKNWLVSPQMAIQTGKG